MSFKGKAWTFGENVNTDLIFPKRFFKPSYERGEMGRHILEGADPEFPAKVGKGDIIVGGSNFGCGSSREEAAGCMRDVGVAAVLAPSFGRIFTRNCINLGVPVITCPGIDGNVDEGDEIEVDLADGVVRNLSNGFEERFPPIAPELLVLLEVGGLTPYTRRILAEVNAARSKRK